MSETKDLNLLIKENKIREAIVLLTEHIVSSPDDAALLFERGKLYWRLGERAKATSDYAAAAAIQPDGPAVQALENARDIESFFNPDLLNP